eukprot:219539_1
MSLCQTTCSALGRYYESLGKPYDALFSAYCDDTGLDDDDALRDEIQQDHDDCILVEFADDFPFNTQPEDENIFIYNVIKQCMDNPDVTFGPSGMPDFNELGPELFQLEPSELADIKKLYKNQCKELYQAEWDADEGFLRVLAAGKKHGSEYLLHLVDDYNRWRVANQDKPYTLTTQRWASNHKHFKQMESLVGKSLIGKSYTQLATGAVDSFGKRVCPKLHWKPMSKIDDDMEPIVDLINNAVDFIHRLATDQFSEKVICPFQVDFCIVLPPTINTESNEPLEPKDKGDIKDPDDDQDESDDDDEKAIGFEVGDIKQRLDSNKLRYIKGECQPDSDKGSRIYRQMLDNFVTTHQLQGSKNEAYLHKKRLITMVDRRKSKKDGDKPDDIWMYEPPADCQNITNDTVPEWYINSSATCLCPKSDTRASFGATTHCKRGTLTLSFHVKEERIIKCYLFWNGQMMRFFPDDIKSVLPGLFNPKKQGKRDKAEEELLDAMIKEMKEKLVDEEFDEFVSSYK